jgi:hypothetical protein
MTGAAFSFRIARRWSGVSGSRLGLNFVQQADTAQGPLSEGAFARDIQITELATDMGPISNFVHALPEARLVTGDVVTDQLALPAVQELTGS